MADKLFKDYFNERQEDNAIQGNTKILIKRGNNVRKIDVDKFATAAQGQLADSAVQPSDLGTMAYEDADDYVDLTSNQTIGGVKSFSNNLGVGIDTPTAKLQINSAFNNLAIKALRSASYGEIIRIGRIGVSELASIDYPADGVIAFSTVNNERLRINSNGNVGIGTTSPAAKLDVNGNTKITGTLDLNDGSNRVQIGTLAGGSGVNQTCVGREAGRASSSQSLTALGFFAGRLTNSPLGTMVGQQAGSGATSANSVMVGYQSGESSTGSNQISIGYQAGRSASGNNSVGFGFQALSGSSNNDSVGLGYQALSGGAGNNVIGLGVRAARLNTQSHVLAIGTDAANANTQSNRTIIDNDLLPAFASFALAEAAFGTGQSGMTYLYFNTVTNAIEGVRF